MPVSPEGMPDRNTGDGPALLRGRHRKLPTLLALWLVPLGGQQPCAWRSGPSPSEAAHGLIQSMAAGKAGLLLYVALFAVRPLIAAGTTTNALGSALRWRRS